LFPTHNPQRRDKNVSANRLINLADNIRSARGKKIRTQKENFDPGDPVDPDETRNRYAQTDNTDNVAFSTEEINKEIEAEEQEGIEIYEGARDEQDENLSEINKNIEEITDREEQGEAIDKKEKDSLLEASETLEGKATKGEETEEEANEQETDLMGYTACLEYDDDEKPVGQKDKDTIESRLLGEGLNIPATDIMYNENRTRKTTADYEIELKKLKRQKKELEAEVWSGEATNNKSKMLEVAGKLNKVDKGIGFINQRLGRKGVDENDRPEQTRATRDTLRQGINNALRKIRGNGDRGKMIADFIKERTDTSDPLSYVPREGDPKWITKQL